MGQGLFLNSCGGREVATSGINLPKIQEQMNIMQKDQEILAVKVVNILDEYCEIANVDDLVMMSERIQRSIEQKKQIIAQHEMESKEMQKMASSKIEHCKNNFEKLRASKSLEQQEQQQEQQQQQQQ